MRSTRFTAIRELVRDGTIKVTDRYKRGAILVVEMTLPIEMQWQMTKGELFEAAQGYMVDNPMFAIREIEVKNGLSQIQLLLEDTCNER